MERGADAFLCKPYDVHFLYARIEQLLQKPVPRRHSSDKQSTTLSIRGEQRTVHAEPQQLLDFLVSIYQQAIQLNKELGRQNRAGIDQNR